MILPPRFAIVITGSLWGVRSRQDDKALLYLRGRLFSGYLVAETALESFNLRIHVEPDSDQAGDEIDLLLDRSPVYRQAD